MCFPFSVFPISSLSSIDFSQLALVLFVSLSLSLVLPVSVRRMYLYLFGAPAMCIFWIVYLENKIKQPRHPFSFAAILLLSRFVSSLLSVFPHFSHFPYIFLSFNGKSL